MGPRQPREARHDADQSRLRVAGVAGERLHLLDRLPADHLDRGREACALRVEARVERLPRDALPPSGGPRPRTLDSPASPRTSPQRSGALGWWRPARTMKRPRRGGGRRGRTTSQRDSKNLAFSLVKRIDLLESAVFDGAVATHADVFRLTRAQVDRLRRAHIALALTELLAERSGGDRCAVGEIVARAGVSRRTFYRLFDGKDQAQAAAAALAFDQALARMRAACRAEQPAAQRVPAAVRAVLELAAEHPARARLWVAEPVMEALPGLLAALDGVADPDAPPRSDSPSRPRDLASALIDAIVNADRATLRALSADPATAAPAEAALAGGPRAVLELTGGLPSRGTLSPKGRQALRLIADRPDRSAADVRVALGHRHASQTSRLLRVLADAGLLMADAPEARPVRWRVTAAGTKTLAADDVREP